MAHAVFKHESAVLHQHGHCSRRMQVCGDIVLTKSLLLPIVIGLRDLWSAESEPQTPERYYQSKSVALEVLDWKAPAQMV